ncbi:predicted protein [Plenodomus lingam JN3]|uniref:Predicted protein n=1 Tax=Leptosphaeria maculans (strain JN3 / isolate v23.1.3 / race Av1-4-5-6-7-8) TaxID=985895 RepID=E5A2H5_LEPMJ|nr:predicted protein [Plenodomus lingam JN3]CBX97771.1 predicted protein [Plenodomus lingam JN3]
MRVFLGDLRVWQIVHISAALSRLEIRQFLVERGLDNCLQGVTNGNDATSNGIFPFKPNRLLDLIQYVNSSQLHEHPNLRKFITIGRLTMIFYGTFPAVLYRHIQWSECTFSSRGRSGSLMKSHYTNALVADGGRRENDKRVTEEAEAVRAMHTSRISIAQEGIPRPYRAPLMRIW